MIAAIEFASPAALGWLAAAALPWLINLWNRRLHVEAPWAAVDLLMEAIQERSRRLRLRELLLLVMRTAILALVALAVARPVWKSVAGADAIAARTHYILVVDRSFSMATHAGGATRLERAKERARDVIERSRAGDAFSVIAWAHSADDILGRPTFDPAAAQAAINSIELSDCVAELPVALRGVSATLQSALRDHPDMARREVVFVSDMTRTAWASALPPVVRAAGSEPEQGDADRQWRRLATRTGVAIQNVDDGVRDNAAIVDLKVDPPLLTFDAPVTVAVSVQALGDRTWSALPVELLLDGRSVEQRSIDIAPGEPAVARFDARVVEAGSHVFEARIPNSVDSLAMDNRRWLAFDVRSRLRAICFVDVAGSAQDLARALNPRHGPLAAEGLGVDVSSATRLASTNLADYDVVFVCNVADLSLRERDLLRNFTAEGGAIVFILGGRVQAEAYNRFFGARATGDKTPRGSLIQVELASMPVDGEWRLDPLDYRHQILAPFAKSNRTGLLGVLVSRYFPLVVHSDASRVQVALGISSGDPAIVIGNYGLGRVAVVTIDPSLNDVDQPWTTLAVSPSFLPLVRELFNFLTADRRMERLNRTVGDTLVTPKNASTRQGAADWHTPDGQTVPVGTGDGSLLTEGFGRGVYSLQVERTQVATVGTDRSSVKVAVNVAPHESDLSTVDVREVYPSGGGSGAERALGASYHTSLHLERGLLTAAAALLLLELMLAWLFGRGWA